MSPDGDGVKNAVHGTGERNDSKMRDNLHATGSGIPRAAGRRPRGRNEKATTDRMAG